MGILLMNPMTGSEELSDVTDAALSTKGFVTTLVALYRCALSYFALSSLSLEVQNEGATWQKAPSHLYDAGVRLQVGVLNESFVSFI